MLLIKDYLCSRNANKTKNRLMMKSPPAEIESPAKAFPAGDPMSGWSYESNVMMPTPMSNAAATMLSNASWKKNVRIFIVK